MRRPAPVGDENRAFEGSLLGPLGVLAEFRLLRVVMVM